MSSRPLRLLAVIALVLGTLLATPGIASAETKRCTQSSGPAAGHCWTVGKARVHVKVVESVPVVNKTRRVVTASCSFSRTVSRGIEASSGEAVTAGAEFFGAAKVEASVSVSRSVSQTGSQASSAGGSMRLQPGERMICQRTYGYTSATVHESQWHTNTHLNKNITYTVKLPSYLGVRIID